jgi:RNA polymerase sigma factor (sigma-70 family)
MATTMETRVRQAIEGNKHALETIVRGIQDQVFRLALRMLGSVPDAEDEAQEILIKVITHLSTFREESAFSTWVYRVACNHLLTTRKRQKLRVEITFEDLQDMISRANVWDCPTESSGPEQAMILEETRLHCMQAVLTCLEREIRIVFILAELFEVTGAEGAYILNITPEAFRKRLSRARDRFQAFMLKNCGLVKNTNPCRCARHAVAKINTMPMSKPFQKTHRRPLNIKIDAMQRLSELSEIERISLLSRSYPEYRCPEAFATIVKDLIDSGKYGILTRD